MCVHSGELSEVYGPEFVLERPPFTLSPALDRTSLWVLFV